MAHPKPTEMLSKKAENRFVEAGRRILRNDGYPNPDRVGCPGAEVLKGLADRTVDIRAEKDSILHLGMCSPCFVEYEAFRKQVVRRKNLRLTMGSVALVLMIGGGVWLWRRYISSGTGGRPNVPTIATYRPFFLDLRNWLVFRGEQPPGAHRGPIQLPREQLDMTIWLPVGGEAGKYDIQVSTELHKLLVTAAGAAVIRHDGVTALKVKLDLSSLKPGEYVLGIGQVGVEPYRYPLHLK